MSYLGLGVSLGTVPVYHGTNLKDLDRKVRITEMVLRGVAHWAVVNGENEDERLSRKETEGDRGRWGQGGRRVLKLRQVYRIVSSNKHGKQAWCDSRNWRLEPQKGRPSARQGLLALRAPEKGQSSERQCNPVLKAPEMMLSVVAFLLSDAFLALPEFQLLTTSTLLPNHLNSC
ncbi:hypothetical protein LR48_Vigan03g099000 [Vigna angularis]|uniref:Uncharacterized protein n=1 Tax=Phaseolus angularis TaxID=3914 RepID=A0A0L9U454_PHAAN|nr:hypothetical protein LR48_Vigan03g099000 [Vigna angularis]